MSSTTDIQNQVNAIIDKLKSKLTDFSTRVRDQYNETMTKITPKIQTADTEVFNGVVGSFKPSLYMMYDTFRAEFSTVITIYNRVILIIATLPEINQGQFKYVLDKNYENYTDALKSTYNAYTTFIYTFQSKVPKGVDYDAEQQKITDIYNEVLAGSGRFYNRQMKAIELNHSKNLQTLAPQYVNALHIDPKNFALEKIEQLGRTTQTWEANIPTSGKFNNVLSYNPETPNLFFSAIDNKNVSDDEAKALKNLTLDDKKNRNVYDAGCDAYFFGTADPDFSVRKNTDFPQMDIKDVCYKRELVKNRDKANKIETYGQTHRKATTGYLERKTDYNVQIINTFNFSLGIVLMLGALYTYRF